LGRRIQETVNSVTTDLYYSTNWQVLEEREGTLVRSRHVWSPVYIDAMVLRDRDGNGDGTLEERLWVQQDANFNVTALLDNSGNVVERYVYDAYGAVTILTSGWGSRIGSSYNWVHLFQGGRHDSGLGLSLFRERVLLVSLGRWLQVDPKGFDAGDVNLYRHLANMPGNALDPMGTDLIFLLQTYWPGKEKPWRWGHAAILIGPLGKEDRYEWFSFGLGEPLVNDGFTEFGFWTSKDNLTRAVFANMNDARTFLLRDNYTHYARFRTDRMQDLEARKAIWKNFHGSDYSLRDHHCGHAAGLGLQSAFPDIRQPVRLGMNTYYYANVLLKSEHLTDWGELADMSDKYRPLDREEVNKWIKDMGFTEKISGKLADWYAAWRQPPRTYHPGPPKPLPSVDETKPMYVIPFKFSFEDFGRGLNSLFFDPRRAVDPLYPLMPRE
jgi:RHS repeat-associated protein